MTLLGLNTDTIGEVFLNQSLSYILYLCLVGLGSSLLSTFTLSRLSKIAHTRRLFNETNERTVHTGLIPRLGGLSFLPVIAFSVCFFTWLSRVVFQEDIEWFIGYSELFPLFAAMLIVYGMGAEDDIIGLSYKPKFVGQIIASLLVVSSGIYISESRGFLFDYVIPNIIAVPLSCLFLLLIINSLNLIDGIDGLAGGLSLLAFLFYGVLFVYCKMYVYALICAVGCGVLIGFLRLNIWGRVDKREKIFMGDTGSLTLGILIGFMSLRVFNIPGEGYLAHMPIAGAVAPLLLPCLDLVHVFTMRILRRRNPFKADRTHIHHRIMDLGFSQRQTLCILLATSMLLTIINTIASLYIDINLLICFDLILWILGNYYLAYKARQTNSH